MDSSDRESNRRFPNDGKDFMNSLQTNFKRELFPLTAERSSTAPLKDCFISTDTTSY